MKLGHETSFEVSSMTQIKGKIVLHSHFYSFAEAWGGGEVLNID